MRAVNLIPADQRAGASVGAGRSQGAAYAVIALVAGLAVMAFLYGQARKEVSSRTSEAATIAAQASQAQSAAAKLSAYETFVTGAESRIASVDSIVDSRFDWAHAFHEFGRVLPLDVSIDSLSGTISSASTGSTLAAQASLASGAGKGATPPGAVPVFDLGGCAATQPAVARMLQRLRLIDGVKEVLLQSSVAASTNGSSTSSTVGACPAGGPVFAVTVTFDPIPTVASPTGSAAATVVSGTAPSAATKQRSEAVNR